MNNFDIFKFDKIEIKLFILEILLISSYNIFSIINKNFTGIISGDKISTHKLFVINNKKESVKSLSVINLIILYNNSGDSFSILKKLFIANIREGWHSLICSIKIELYFFLSSFVKVLSYKLYIFIFSSYKCIISFFNFERASSWDLKTIN